MIRCEYVMKILLPIMISLQERQNRQHQPLGKIHTGLLWAPARQRYCGDDPDAFPLALVCFDDKTNTHVFGSLSCAPFICIPSFLNKDRRNDDSNYMVLGYIPNLGYGKGKEKRQLR
jgi:hypothetical protein